MGDDWIDEEADSLGELHESLKENEPEDTPSSSEQVRHDCFDLCEACHQQFLENPLGREVLETMGFFSAN
ncbi:MAG: hypothetical protein AAF664_12800 [Planctomycetota bacterium]